MEWQSGTDSPVIAVVGLGPRGMVIVERLVAHLRARPDLTVDLILFDGNEPGAGLHRPDLPDYLLLNTVAGQLSFYPHPEAVDGTAPHQGPNLQGWCLNQGIRLNARGEVSADPSGRPVAAGDFLPRRLLGQYMQDMARRLLDLLPDHIRVQHIRENVVNLTRHAATGRQGLTTNSGRQFWADRVFFSLGHARGPEAPELAVKPRESLAIAGLGLTAMDMVAALTKGRGGLFAGSLDQLRYIQSGREPQIFLVSRSGLPFFARPDWYPADDHLRTPPVFLTRKAIDRLRRASGETGGRLCFRTQVLPLLRLDMYASFYVTRRRLSEGLQAAKALLLSLALLEDVPDIAEALFLELEQQHGPSGIEQLLRTAPWQGPASAFSQTYRQTLRADLEQCGLGVAVSPIKAAAEVWRNQRDILRYAANGHGLTDASRGEFYRVYAPLSNRLVGGPQKERHAELLALCAANVVRLLPPDFLGLSRFMDPQSKCTVNVDRFLSAQAGTAGTRRRDATLMHNLLAAGRVRPINGDTLDGIDVDSHGHPIDPQGKYDPAIWFVGAAVEGASFYNHYVGTPAPDCPLFIDGEREVRRCLDQLGQPIKHLPLRSALPKTMASS